MTIRKRVKHKWHFTLGDFKFNKATYHPNGDRSFDVLYKNDLIGHCYLKHYNSKKIAVKINITAKGNYNT